MPVKEDGMRREIESDSIGDSILTSDAGVGPISAVTTAGGWCSVKQIEQRHYAEKFAASGIAAVFGQPVV
jgi:hypothetical protein